jgi:hypothetical protein
MNTIVLTSREKYHFIQHIIKELQKFECFIFGGAARDLIYHDLMAEKFYESIDEKDLIEKRDLYQDPEFLPEFGGRFLLPNDIDVFMSTENVDKFIGNIRKDETFKIRVIKTGRLNIYMPELNSENLTGLFIKRIEIYIRPSGYLKKLVRFEGDNKVEMDIIYKDDIHGYYPPFGKVDFECNSLLLSSTGDLMISPYLYGQTTYKSPHLHVKKINEIIENIRKKGWDMVYKDVGFEYLLTLKQFEDCDTCMFCLTEFEESDYKLQRKCCIKCIAHQKCWRDYVNSECKKECPLCTNPITDVELLRRRPINLW